MNPRREDILGMILDVWEHKSCMAQVGTGDDWATIYLIKSEDEGKGHGAELIQIMKDYYESKGLEFCSSIALNPKMRHLLQKFNIKEYK